MNIPVARPHLLYAHAGGVSTAAILAAADWKSAPTLRRFYCHDVTPPADCFSAEVLCSATAFKSKSCSFAPGVDQAVMVFIFPLTFCASLTSALCVQFC